MQLKNLITDANRELYKRVTENLPIQFKKSNNNSWGSNKEEKRIIISHCETNHPEASFTHELLHIDTQMQGYRRLRSGLSLNSAVLEQLPFLCEMIDNEFQHHKMYSKFLQLGYPPHEFYNDADAQADQYVSNGIEAKGQSLTSITSIYFTLIAPGGSIPSERIATLKNEFRKYDQGAFRERFDDIDKIIHAWTVDSTYHAERHIIDVLNVLGCGDTWVSYFHNAENFPQDGFFTTRTFTIDDINKAYASK
ncbi:hypothetical protein [Chryseolinea lacunae]|uniref:Ferritin-like domain-containing protein n=1 Tax=Chryseolinea lacunae TaxID=2801331 RepID=A0ABS1KSY3_9BACT|nr:hypothetical protein [Chryseolinea lacunae]MBL0741396.1 hypothetical protein [Chryseolinea lacunae]